MFRNVSLRAPNDARPDWQLLGPDGRPIDAFEAFQKTIRVYNTRAAYCHHVAELIDYLFSTASIVAGGGALTKMQLTDALHAYWDYLRLGQHSRNPIAQQVAILHQQRPNKPSSLIPKRAAVRQFLVLSETIRQEIADRAKFVVQTSQPVDPLPLTPEANQKRALTSHQVSAMQRTTMMSGVIAHGPKLISAVPLQDDEDQVEYDENRAFPYDEVSHLIATARSYRDKCHYALLAASGCRTSEALQILLEDINIQAREVKLVDPKKRPAHSSYLSLTHAERQRLVWKGRTSELTLLIEPFATEFFENLQQYLQKEYIAHGRHDFVFQRLKGELKGQPYFLSSASSRLEIFNSACKRINVRLPAGTGPHSLRHMYGTYAVNYFPRENGDFGLPLPIVQQMMGHSSIKSTEKYARRDKDLLVLELQAANRHIFGRGLPPDLRTLKLAALEAQIKKIQAQLPTPNLLSP